MIMYHNKTAKGTIAETITPAVDFQIEQMLAKFSSTASTGTLLVTLDRNGLSTAGVYDTVLDSKAMAGVTSYVWRPTRPIICRNGDVIKINCGNATGITYGVEMAWSLI